MAETQNAMARLVHPVYSITTDATRLSKKDYLFGSIYGPSSQEAAWCTPVVHRGSYCKVRFANVVCFGLQSVCSQHGLWIGVFASLSLEHTGILRLHNCKTVSSTWVFLVPLLHGQTYAFYMSMTPCKTHMFFCT